MENILIKETNVNSLITLSKLPSADYVINPYVGCTHACKYCYATFMKRFTGHDEAWGSFLDVKRCNKPINLDKLKGKTVFLSSVTDCYNPEEEKYKITHGILKELLNAGIHLNIATKSSLILRDLELLKQFKNLVVSISINTLDDKFQTDMDNASSIKERINTLKILHKNGIKTVLFVSPIFPYITDFRELIEATKDYASEYWFENLNLRADYKKTILDYIKINYPMLYPKYVDIYLKNNPGYWDELSIEIANYCAANQIKYVNYFHHQELVKK